MAYIGRGTESISNVEVLDNLTFDGSASYTLQKSSTNFVPSSANNLLISISGVVQQGNFSVSGSTITFDTTVSASDTCDWILHYGTGLITTPADGTVSNDKIAYPLAESGATVSSFNRTTNEGNIIELQKDGTEIGNIGTRYGYLRLGKGNTQLVFDSGNDRIAPSDGTGVAKDNSVTLGWSDRRFKHLYVGSNIYLGGTGSANALDDYEEGTWTPTFYQGYTGITYLAQYGWYRKIGNLVSVSCAIQFSATANSTSVRINLPFTQTVRNYGGGGIPYCNISDFANTNPYVGFNQSYLQYYEIGTGTNISSTTSPSSKWISFVISMATS